MVMPVFIIQQNIWINKLKNYCQLTIFYTHPLNITMRAQTQKKPIICLIQPNQKFNQQFSELRNHLRKWKIQFQQDYSYKNINTIICDDKYHYIIIINNSSAHQLNVPTEIVGKPAIHMYVYPLKNNKFPTLKSPSHLVDLYQAAHRYHIGEKVKMLAVKRNMSLGKKRKKEQNVENKHFDNVVVYSQYTEESFERFIRLVQGENKIIYISKNYQQLKDLANRYCQLLLVTTTKDFLQLRSLLKSEGIENKYDMILLGIKNSQLNTSNNIILITDELRYVFETIQSSGIILESAIEQYVEEQRRIMMKKGLKQKSRGPDSKDQNRFTPQTIIQQLSDEYQGSNRESYVVDQLQKQIREGVEKKIEAEEAMKKRQNYQGSESKKETTNEYWNSDYNIKITEEESIEGSDSDPPKQNLETKKKIQEILAKQSTPIISFTAKKVPTKNPQLNSQYQPKSMTSSKSVETMKSQTNNQNLIIPKTANHINHPTPSNRINPTSQYYQQSYKYEAHTPIVSNYRGKKQELKPHDTSRSPRILDSKSIDFSKYEKCIENGRVIYRQKQSIVQRNYQNSKSLGKTYQKPQKRIDQIQEKSVKAIPKEINSLNSIPNQIQEPKKEISSSSQVPLKISKNKNHTQYQQTSLTSISSNQIRTSRALPINPIQLSNNFYHTPSIKKKLPQALTNYSKGQTIYSPSSHYTHEDRRYQRDSSTGKQSSDQSIINLNHQLVHGQVYNSSRPYYQTSITKLETLEEIAEMQKQFIHLSLQPNCLHYLALSTHKFLDKISSYMNYRDKLEVCHNIQQIQRKVIKRVIPNEIYDLGLILIPNIAEFNKSFIYSGYYFVDINPTHPEISICKSRNHIKVSRIENLPFAYKLILASMIQYYVFSHRDDQDSSKILRLFPAATFHKFHFSNYRDLVDRMYRNANLKNRTRLKRVIVLSNEKNIEEINQLYDHELNLGNLEIFCNLQTKDIIHMTSLYPKVKFMRKNDFTSYGSMIKNSPDQKQLQSMIKMTYSSLSKANSQRIYIDAKHKKTLPSKITQYLFSKYEIEYFGEIPEIKPNKNIPVLLHPKSDYIGSEINVREFESVYMVGTPKTRLLPGVTRIDNEDILQLF